MDNGDFDYSEARRRVLSWWEVGYIRGLLEHTSGNVSAAAREADVDRTTLYRLMRRHGIERDEFTESEGE